jgi:hypothetical protein
MAQSKIISYIEFMKGNKRVCLSVFRGLGKCFKCTRYLTCESKIPYEQYDKLLNYKKYLADNYNKKIAEIQEKISKL